jgi:hypothetical protein
MSDRKVPVTCGACGAARFVRPPAPAAYVCQRCTATAAPSSPRATASRDPWTLNTREPRSAPARWLTRRKGWLRHE